MMYAFDDRSDRSFVVASEELLELGERSTSLKAEGLRSGGS